MNHQITQFIRHLALWGLVLPTALYLSAVAAPAQDWSLRKDKIRSEKGKREKGPPGGVHKAKKQKKKKKKLSDAATGVVGTAGGKVGQQLPAPEKDEFVSLFAMLVSDPTDRFLVEKLAEKIPEGGLPADDELDALAARAGVSQRKEEMRLAFAHLLIATGNLDRASTHLAALEKIIPNLPSLYFLKAKLLSSSSAFADALTFLRKALAKCNLPADSVLKGRIYEAMVQVALSAGDGSAAAEAFVQSLRWSGQLDELFEEILASLAAEDKGEAVSFIRKVLAAFPWSKYEKFYLQMVLAENLLAAGKPAEAMDAASRAISAYVPSTVECERAVDLYLESASELGVMRQAAMQLAKERSFSCVFFSFATRREDKDAGKDGERGRSGGSPKRKTWQDCLRTNHHCAGQTSRGKQRQSEGIRGAGGDVEVPQGAVASRGTRDILRFSGRL